MKILLIFSFIILINFSLISTIINIPADQPTIQQGIDVSVDGDTVLVQPGTYIENINYNGKLITIKSAYGPENCIIDGNQNGSVVTFENNEDSTSILDGFTIIHGLGDGSWSFWSGGGITTVNSSPTIKRCIIKNNTCPFIGAGVASWNSSSPTFINCMIHDNEDVGIFLTDPDAIFINCLVFNNLIGMFFESSNPQIINSTIVNNNEEGIQCHNNSNPELINSIVWNNEIMFHSICPSSSISISYSNIEGGEEGIETNDNGTVYWLEGNIAEEPLFIGTGEHPFSLLEDSPCIDAGTPDTTELNLPPFDIIGNPRIFGGIIDMGTYEWQGTSIDNDEFLISNFKMYNFPNPFNPETTISFNLTAEDAKNAKLEIYNIKGQRIKQFSIDNCQCAKAHKFSIVWDGRDSNGKRVSSGIYFYKLKTGSYSTVKKMLLLQ